MTISELIEEARKIAESHELDNTSQGWADALDWLSSKRDAGGQLVEIPRDLAEALKAWRVRWAPRDQGDGGALAAAIDKYREAL